MRFLYPRAGFPLENIYQNGQISRQELLSLSRYIRGRWENQHEPTALECGVRSRPRGSEAMDSRNDCLASDDGRTAEGLSAWLHYMRGPGPKWREKHACQHDPAAR